MVALPAAMMVGITFSLTASPASAAAAAAVDSAAVHGSFNQSIYVIAFIHTHNETLAAPRC